MVLTELQKCLMMRPSFFLFVHFYPFFMVGRFIAAAVVFHVICIKG